MRAEGAVLRSREERCRLGMMGAAVGGLSPQENVGLDRGERRGDLDVVALQGRRR